MKITFNISTKEIMELSQLQEKPKSNSLFDELFKHVMESDNDEYEEVEE